MHIFDHFLCMSAYAIMLVCFQMVVLVELIGYIRKCFTLNGFHFVIDAYVNIKTRPRTVSIVNNTGFSSVFYHIRCFGGLL